MLAEYKTAASETRNRHSLHTMFAPRSIAIVGASEKSIWTHYIMRNFQTFGYAGQVHVVNRGAKPVFGQSAHPNCQAIGEPVDLGFIILPKEGVPDALEDLAAAGIPNVVILTSGYAETGGEGAHDQDVLLAQARQLGIRVWGPNTLGFNNISARIPVSAIPAVQPILEPSIAIVSQSGASASELLEYAHSQNVGASFVAATGNQGDITLSDVIDYLVDDDATRAIAVFAETICDPQNFVKVAMKARAKNKPIVMLKIGRSALAGAIAAAHTGSLIGDDGVFSAICDRLAIIRVYSTEELIEVAGLLAATGRLSEPGLSFISISGGSCTLVADAADVYGVSLPANDPKTAVALAEVLPGFASGLNPLDITGAAMRDPDLFERIIPVAAKAEGVGLVAVNMPIPTVEGQSVPAALAAIGRAAKNVDKPIIIAQTCAKALNEVSRSYIDNNALPHVITGLDATLRAIGKANWWSQEVGRDILPPALGAGIAQNAAAHLASEVEVLRYLDRAGVPVVPITLAATREEAITFAAKIDGKVVLKIASPDIAHKTEVGGVKLNVAQDGVGDAFDAIMRSVASHRPDAQIDGLIVAPMRGGAATELIVSYINDPSWGGVLTVGLGGSLVELIADTAIAPMPVDRATARGMLLKLRCARLLLGYRGGTPADLDTLADAIVAIGEAGQKLGTDLASLEINPVRVDGASIEALDGLATWHTQGVSHDH
jgi:acyl-CoA synthetase (NDP forming)